jgi:hypothetical protein
VYAVGVWYGLLSMAGFKTATVNPMHWKGDLGLRGLDKDDSRLLARQMVPSKASVLEWVCSKSVLEWVCSKSVLEWLCSKSVLEWVCSKSVLEWVCSKGS